MSDFHESTEIDLKFGKSIKRETFHRWAIAFGLVLMDDFYFCPRTDKPKPWQAESVFSITLFFKGVEPYVTDEDISEGNGGMIDSLRIEYLMGPLPRGCIDVLLGFLERIIIDFDVTIFFPGENVNLSQMKLKLFEIADVLDSEFDGAGSDSWATLFRLSR
ncbi:hypothetical protein [Deefgea sp. CFH1-16]|uniref:hypothetical protein n=1 Tax=Deefgea sp. CFH1-16 TaxID=2675457 RepID=UPI0015F59C12|nr:hypothetical protein [Deefgea sp. CFH1-16]MBM5575370.1 hypothetical protein [Deefgea sp. CFH1-16]